MIVEGIFKIAVPAVFNSVVPKSFVEAGAGDFFQSPGNSDSLSLLECIDPISIVVMLKALGMS